MSDDARQDPRAQIMRYVDRAYEALERASYYELLNLPADVTRPALRDRYYKLASRLHPDLHGDCLAPDEAHKLTSVYSRIVEAYKILRDGERRAQYDAGLAEGKLRWDADAGARRQVRRVEDDVKNPSARKFFVLGRDALRAGNGKAAVMNLRMALSMEPGNAVIQAELTRAEALAETQGGL